MYYISYNLITTPAYCGLYNGVAGGFPAPIGRSSTCMTARGCHAAFFSLARVHVTVARCCYKKMYSYFSNQRIISSELLTNKVTFQPQSEFSIFSSFQNEIFRELILP